MTTAPRKFGSIFATCALAIGTLVALPAAIIVLDATDAAAVDANDDASFRAAFETTVGPVTIILTGSFALSCAPVNRNDAGTATIIGNGNTITMCATSPMLQQAGAGAIELQGVTLSGSTAAVTSSSTGAVSLTDSIVTNVVNGSGIATGVTTDGGAITLVNSQVTGVNGTTLGVGIATDGGNVSLNNSLVGNTGGGTALAVSVGGSGTATLTNSLVANTTGGITTAIGVGTTAGAVTLTNAAVDNTSAPSVAIGVSAGGGTMTLTDSLVSSTSSDSTTIGVNIENGPATLTRSGVTGTSGAQAFGVIGDASATLEDSSITKTSSEVNAAYGVTSDGPILLTRSSVADTMNTNSVAIGVFGDTTTLVDSAVQRTTGVDTTFGAGADNLLTLVRSTISGTAGGFAVGAISDEGSVRATNSTITDNTGFGILADVDVTLVYSDVVNNGGAINPTATGFDRVSLPEVTAQQVAAQVDAGGNVTSFASVITLPRSGFVNCGASGTISSTGYNFSDDTTCNLTGTGDRQGAGLNALLGALANNGGFTPTLLPAANSPLLDSIPEAACQADGAAGVVTDQRGITRPQGGLCDVGSVEIFVPVALLPAFTG